LDEAEDINTYLKPLRPIVEKLSGTSEPAELIQIFPSLMHTLLLIWKCSKHYNTPNRLSIVLREICNDVIEQARNIIQPTELFGTEPEEAAERIRQALKVCEAFKNSFLDVKASTAESKNPWNLEGNVIFSRFDAFVSRVSDTLSLFTTIIEFNKLEKIEIGGTKVHFNPN
jgi:dynein heavy chain